jgi:hypothetical protein
VVGINAIEGGVPARVIFLALQCCSIFYNPFLFFILKSGLHTIECAYSHLSSYPASHPVSQPNIQPASQPASQPNI